MALPLVRDGCTELMKSMHLPKMSTIKSKFRYHKPEVSLKYPNLLNQQFNPNEPNRAWVSDITYIPVKKNLYIFVLFWIYFQEKSLFGSSHIV